MNKFIKKTFLFISVTIILVAAIFIASLNIIESNASFKIDKRKNKLLLGHSHSECAFDDAIITNLKNYSQSGESYYYSYAKLKPLLEQNPHIDTVFIEFSNNQIDEVMDSWIWGRRYMMSKLPVYFSFISKEDLKNLRSGNSSAFTAATSKAFRRNLTRLITRDFNFADEIGGYQRLDRHKVDSLVKAYHASKPVIPETITTSEYSMQYLAKCIAYCKEKGVEVILVRSPQHKYFAYTINETQFLNIKDSLFGDVKFIDFNNFPINDDEFGDFGHLNYKGAEKFSKTFEAYSQNKLKDTTLLTFFN